MSESTKPSQKLVGIHGPHYYSEEFIVMLHQHFERHAVIWAAGLDKPTAADLFAYDVLKNEGLL